MSESEKAKMEELQDPKGRLRDQCADQGGSAPTRNLSDPGDPSSMDPDVQKKLAEKKKKLKEEKK